MTIKIYISNSIKDETVKSSLVKHLNILQRKNDFELYTDSDVEFGLDHEVGIENLLSKSDIIIPLVSVDYINECKTEMDFIDKSFSDVLNKKQICSIIVGTCNWDYTTLKGTCLTDLTNAKDIDKSLSDFALNILARVDNLRRDKVSTSVKIKKIRVSPFAARAGEFNDFENYEGEKDNLFLKDTQCSTIFPIDGNSANPKYKNGDYLLCQKIETKYRITENGWCIHGFEPIKHQEVYVIETQTKGLLAKKIDMNNFENGNIILKSVNESYKDIVLPNEEIKMIWKIKRIVYPKLD